MDLAPLAPRPENFPRPDAHALADTLVLVLLTRGRFELTEIHVLYSTFFVHDL